MLKLYYVQGRACQLQTFIGALSNWNNPLTAGSTSAGRHGLIVVRLGCKARLDRGAAKLDG